MANFNQYRLDWCKENYADLLSPIMIDLRKKHGEIVTTISSYLKALLLQRAFKQLSNLQDLIFLQQLAAYVIVDHIATEKDIKFIKSIILEFIAAGFITETADDNKELSYSALDEAKNSIIKYAADHSYYAKKEEKHAESFGKQCKNCENYNFCKKINV